MVNEPAKLVLGAPGIHCRDQVSVVVGGTLEGNPVDSVDGLPQYLEGLKLDGVESQEVLQVTPVAGLTGPHRTGIEASLDVGVLVLGVVSVADLHPYAVHVPGPPAGMPGPVLGVQELVDGAVVVDAEVDRDTPLRQDVGAGLG